MKKYIAWLLIATIAGGSLIAYYESVYWLSRNDPKVDFPIGRWVLEESESSDQFSIKAMDFVDFDTLLLYITKNGINHYNVQYQYTFIAENKIRITAPRRLTSEWEVIKSGDLLILNSNVWPGGTGVFKRGVNMNWPTIAILLGFCIAGSFLIVPPLTKTENQGLGRQGTKQTNHSNLSAYIHRIIGTLTVFVIGTAVGLLMWSWPPLLRIRLPWDTIIILELSVILFVVGMRTIRANLPIFVLIGKIGWLYFLGILLIGVSIPGVVSGLAKLIVFILFQPSD